MSNKQLFPVEITAFSLERIIYEHSRKSNIIYWTIILFLTGAFTSLFFIKVDVSVHAAGLVKPPGERISVYAPVSGRINYIPVVENQLLRQGDTLLIVEREIVNEQLKMWKARRDELSHLLADLSLLLNLNGKNQTINREMKKLHKRH